MQAIHLLLATYCKNGIFNSCNIGTRDLPDMYAQRQRAADLKVEGIHIRQIMSIHVTSNMYHFQYSKNRRNLQITALHVFVGMGSHCDCGILNSMFL